MSDPDSGVPAPGEPEFTSVILSAGRGVRFGRIGEARPKALLPVLDRPILVWQLEALQALGVRETVLVVGHLRELVEAAAQAGLPCGMALAFALQAQPLGIAHALGCAAERLTRPFLCLLGDVFFAPRDLFGVAGALAGADAVLGVRASPDPREVARNFRVELDPAGWVRGVEEKPRHARPGWMGVGLYAFRPEFLAIAQATPPSALRNERELTDAIQRHLEAGARIRAVACPGPDFNLSTPADLLAANLHALAGTGRESWLEASAEIEPGACVERSVVLGGARIASGARLVRALVFPGERVPAGEYRETVFAGGQALVEAGATGPRR